MTAEYSAEDFVGAIYGHAFRGGVDAALESMEKPPGRAPRQHLLELNAWYITLDENDRAMLRKAVELAASYAVTGVLTLMDGVAAITDYHTREVHATLEGEGESILLAPDQDLYAIFGAMVEENRE